MRRLFALLVLALVAACSVVRSEPATSQAAACEPGRSWLWSGATGDLSLGEYNRLVVVSWRMNRYLVLATDAFCDVWTCGIGNGGVSNIGLLATGDAVTLCNDGATLRGRVIERRIESETEQACADFYCPGATCGVIVAPTGDRRYEWGPVDEVIVVRVAYQ